MSQKITIGRIVEFFPVTTEYGLKLPNGMVSAPAIAVKIFDNYTNFNAFFTQTSPAVKNAFSVAHKDNAPEGCEYWDWLPRV